MSAADLPQKLRECMVCGSFSDVAVVWSSSVVVVANRWRHFVMHDWPRFGFTFQRVCRLGCLVQSERVKLPPSLLYIKCLDCFVVAFAFVTLSISFWGRGTILALICISIATVACRSVTFRPEVFTREVVFSFCRNITSVIPVSVACRVGGLHALLCRAGVTFRRRVAARGPNLMYRAGDTWAGL